MATRRDNRPSVSILQHLKTARDTAMVAARAAGYRVASSLRAYPRVGSVAIGLMALGVLMAFTRGPEEAVSVTSAEAEVVPNLAQGLILDVPSYFEVSESHQPGDKDVPNDAHPAKGTDSTNGWRTVTVQSGETLEVIFRRLDLSPGLLHQVVNLDEHTRKLTRIRPGDTFDFDIRPRAGFKAMRAALDEANWLLVERNGDGLTARLEGRELDRRQVDISAEITSSLFNAGKQAGLKDNTILQMARIFGWDVDFALDIRAGDQFALIYEEVYRDGEYLRDGDIIAARFTNQGRTFEAVRFEVDGEFDYYAPDGRPMRQAFLRAPLDFRRVSSDFNPRRLHPVTRRVRPHNGTDYAADTGTPVWAAGTGRVIESSYNRANGNYIFIQHGNNIVTRYLHLSKKHVRRGDRVQQGDTIGLVGATGLANGPHLHYEFLVEGAHRNPRTVDLPKSEPLDDHLLEQFRHQAAPLLAQLESLELDEQRLLAQRSDEE